MIMPSAVMSFHICSVSSGPRKIIRLLAEGTTSAFNSAQNCLSDRVKDGFEALVDVKHFHKVSNNEMNPLEVLPASGCLQAENF